MMNAGLVETSALVSLGGIEELTEFQRNPDGSVRIGAMRCHRETAFESELRGGQQVVSRAASKIANAPVRNMGTLGGSIAFADPAADYPPALVAADASIEIAGTAGRREVPAESFFHGWYETALEHEEIVTAVVLPNAPAGSVGCYEKLARVAGDFAVASIALCMSCEGDEISTIRFAVGGCGGGPIRVPAAEQMLIGQAPHAETITPAGNLLVEALDPVDDVRASADYRRLVVPRLLAKIINAAHNEARGR